MNKLNLPCGCIIRKNVHISNGSPVVYGFNCRLCWKELKPSDIILGLPYTESKKAFNWIHIKCFLELCEKVPPALKDEKMQKEIMILGL